MKSLSSKVEDIIGNPKLYCEAINMITMIPMVEGNTWKDKIKYVLEEGEEEGQGMDDAVSEETPDTGDDGNTEVFYFKNATATFSSFTHEPEVVKF